ncbi:hypothetical protein [Crocosphaera sp.]|uniref:hypothetical protein n=1 Tax=Crocosphaera sp. TaxID=2729996 RepID=UPI0026100B44|nr:hypothetical protein [Crocosphaera sp.]MDJ0581670.1 hypothetical protein [Crocosphaera sp.]
MFQKLPRIPMRPEEEPGIEKEIWQPKWKCFCCYDTGIVNAGLAELVIDGYDFNRDKLPRCQNQGCDAGEHYDSPSITKCIDYRLSPEICKQLDQIQRENWRQTQEKWRENQKIKINYSSILKSLRVIDRPPEEDYEAKRRHEDARNE